ncbi:hypothetical protein KA005_85220, partial [bacterium]|nr:hypothetical protein [bacterium]
YLMSSLVVSKLMNYTVAMVGEEAFFNDPATLVDGWIPGISNIATFNLSYGFHSKNVIMNYGMSDAYLPDVPGWKEDSMGAGIGQFNSRYDSISPYIRAALNSDYFTTDLQLDGLSWYTGTMIYYYVGQPAFNYFYPGESWATANSSAGFYKQWANGTYINDGIDLFEFFGYNWVEFGDPGLKGLEAGLAAPTNITLAQANMLWAEWDNNSFCNDVGFLAWMEAAAGDMGMAAYLMGYFGLTPTQFGMVASWLNDYMNNITPVWIENSVVGPGYDIESIATSLFHEHWANGTIMGAPQLPGGFLNELSVTLAGAPFFEIGLPAASNLTVAQTSALWSLASDKTFFFSDSFNSIWYPALNNDSASQDFIMSEFGLDLGELAAVLGWLGALIGLDPTTGRIAQIIEVEKGVPLATIVLLAVYEQWANGTINGEVAIPDGLLSRRSPPIYGPPYFELGLMYPIGITVAQTMALWNEASEYSLVTVSGIHKWYGAAPGKTIYDDLKTQNGLGDIQMGAILEWLPVFRDVIANKLGENDKNLPMTPYALGETLVLSLGIGGGALAALGVVMLILSRRT